jgi:hypothetical protein
MKSLAKRVAEVIGGVAIAALLLALAAPKAVHAIVSTLVTVSNTTANPVPTRATDNPARQAVLLIGAVDVPDGFSGEGAPMSSSFGGPEFTVPAGQRLVVESVSGDIVTPTGQTPLRAAILSNSPAGIVPVAVFQGTDGSLNHFSFATPFTDYLDPGIQLQASCARGPSTSGTASCEFFVSGHLESIQ